MHFRLRLRRIAASGHLEPDPGNAGVGSLRNRVHFCCAHVCCCWQSWALLCFYGLFFVGRIDMSTVSYSKTRIMTEGAMMIALSTVLSMVKVFTMPYGGSVTLLSMLPLILMSFRHGTKWGLGIAFVHSLLQILLDVSSVAAAGSLGAQIGCVLLDYVLAFTALGLADAFAKPFSNNKLIAVAVATFGVCFLRFLCSFFSGWLLWGSYKDYYDWAKDLPVWLYSLIYNGSYMLPETIVTIVGAILLVKAMPKQFEHQ